MQTALLHSPWGHSAGDGTGLPRPTTGAAALASGDPSALASLFYPDDWIAAHPQQAASVLPEPHSPEAMSIHSKASDRPDGPAPENITAPTLILHGSNDPISDPGNAEILGNRIPNAEVFMVPDARHAYWAGNQKFMPWLQNSSHRTTQNEAFVVLPRRISDLMPTQRTQLTPTVDTVGRLALESRDSARSQRCRSVHVRCVDTGMARVGNRIFHPDVLLLQTTATRLQRFTGKHSPRRRSMSPIITSAPRQI